MPRFDRRRSLLRAASDNRRRKRFFAAPSLIHFPGRRSRRLAVRVKPPIAARRTKRRAAENFEAARNPQLLAVAISARQR